MLVIHSPDNFREEKTYVFKEILQRRLAIPYQLSFTTAITQYQLLLPNGHIFSISDHFFGSVTQSDNTTYLNTAYLPATRQLQTALTPLSTEWPIPVLFGSPRWQITDNHWHTDNDWIGAVFFFLTRWEEVVVPTRDNWGCFPTEAAWNYQMGLKTRPIVDEIEQALIHSLHHLGYHHTTPKANYQFIPTHDIDIFRFWRNPLKALHICLKRIFHPNAYQDYIPEKITYWHIIQNPGLDVYYSYSFLMDLAEKYGHTAWFFFKATPYTTHYDDYYSLNSSLIQRLFQQIKQRGHQIGFHPGYYTFNQKNNWHKEKQRLEKALRMPVVAGRQHYLRFQNPHTWQIWNEARMQWDSTLGFANANGFRCGTCKPFVVFDILNRKELQLIEKPMIIMDSAFFKNDIQHLKQGDTPQIELCYNELLLLKQIVKKHRGNLIFNWHNTHVFTPVWQICQPIFTQLYY